MANEEHVKIVRQGAKAIAAWRIEHPDEKLDLSGADLSGANLSHASLQRVNLGGANLYEAKLSEAILHEANLSEANLRKTDLSGTDLFGAHLADANLSGANLYEADLSVAELSGAFLGQANLSEAEFIGANLHGATLGGAELAHTVFANADLSSAKGLSTVVHRWPSSIGVDTILKSGGKIPDEFLRGCGYNPRIQGLLLGDRWVLIDAAHEAVHRPPSMKLQSCFISYSSQNSQFADRLQKRLNESGVNYWYAPGHGKRGQGPRKQTDKQISTRDRVILLCSKDSLDESDWVLHEIDTAFREEKRRKADGMRRWRVLFPVMIDDTLTNWQNHRQSRLLEVLAGDFIDATKGRAFEECFETLLERLKADGIR